MRKHVVWVAAIVAAITVPGVALADNTQTIEGTVTPTSLSKNTFGAARLSVRTSTRDETNPEDGTPSPANRALIHFDDDVKITTLGLPRCAQARINGKNTQQAKAACPTSVVGGGTAKARLANPGDPSNPFNIDVVVTAFNGRPVGGKAVILLHTVPSAGTPTDLIGVLKRSSGDFGVLLDVDVPPIAGGVGALIDFFVAVRKGYVDKVRRVVNGRAVIVNVRRQYISARCHDANKKFNYKSTFRYDSAPSENASDTSPCTVRP